MEARPEDRLFAIRDPFWRRARRRFPQLLLACLLLHLTVLLFLFLADQPDKNIAAPEKEIPVSGGHRTAAAPPRPHPPKPEQKKPEQPKPKPPQYEREEKARLRRAARAESGDDQARGA